MKIGNQDILSSKIGSTNVSKVYIGSNQVFPINYWTPANTSTSIWLDASDTATITHAANVVSAFADKSGNNIVLDANNEANKPLTNTRTINGLNVLGFKDSDFLKSQVNLATPSNGEMMVFVVGDYDGPTGTQFKGGFWGLRNFAGTSRLSLLPYNTTQNDATIVYQSSLGAFGQTYVGIPYNDTAIFEVNYNAADGLFRTYLNGEYNSVSSITEPWNPLMMDMVWIGKNTYDNVGSMPCGFAEMIVVNSIDPVIREKTEGYLAWKWGLVANLPIGHPYKSQRPVI